MTTYQFYLRTRDILHRTNDASVIEDIKALCILDEPCSREMRREDWTFALNRIDKHLAWLRSIYYPATKAELQYRTFVEENLDRYAVA